MINLHHSAHYDFKNNKNDVNHTYIFSCGTYCPCRSIADSICTEHSGGNNKTKALTTTPTAMMTKEEGGVMTTKYGDDVVTMW
jgi:hypothetical protein